MRENQILNKVAITKQLFTDAFERLKKGQSKKVKPKKSGRITVTLIANEAGKSDSLIYSKPYRKFKVELERKVKSHNDKVAENQSISEYVGASTKNNDKEELKKQVRLKEKYRSERDDYKKAYDKLLSQHASLEFQIYQMQLEAEDKKRATLIDGYFDKK